jgi:hypothetical protein
MASGPIAERNQGKIHCQYDKIKVITICQQFQTFSYVYILDATIYVGGLDEKVSETLLWELFVQAGPVGKKHSSFSSTNLSF